MWRVKANVYVPVAFSFNTILLLNSTLGSQYVPASQEAVIGTVIARHGEGYRVDIGSAHHASLDALAFESATKRNRPNLKVRFLVFCKKEWSEWTLTIFLSKIIK